MRRNIFHDREERSVSKYSGVFRPSHDLSRNDTSSFFDSETGAPNKRYSFLVKASNSQERRPLTSKNTFTNAPQPDTAKHQESRKFAFQDKNDENIQKKYISMTPTNVRKPQNVPSGKKHSFVTASKSNIQELSRPNHHKANSFRADPKIQSRKLEVTSGHKNEKTPPHNSQQQRRPEDSTANKSVREFEIAETKKTDKYFEYIMRYSYRSKKGFIPNTQKFNQDAYIVAPNINKKSWQHYFGICDGHGNFGHHVSAFIKNSITQMVSSTPNLDKNPCESLFKIYKNTVDKLVNESKIDLSYSGSTVIGCYMVHDKIFCCNVGDSRAIIGAKDKNGGWMVQPLSNDHKPSIPSEADRILKCKGRVDTFKDPQGNSVGPLRVWLRDSSGPGLAMTRSFGDLVAASVGVCWQPEIISYTMSQNDKIILIASDGVWQFLENDVIISKLVPYYEANKIEEACDFLLEYANSAWNKECTIIDDISFVLIFMNYGC